ncbi:hypothetical protein [Pontibacter sp. H249]|uniref:hypothetical protein n=1 Tax=Pontibacter sp. H249 TaxID=3133420 RepID=UPI0030C32D9C
MSESANTSKSLKQLCNEAYALSGYLRNNPTDEKASALLHSTTLEIKQLQEATNREPLNS